MKKSLLIALIILASTQSPAEAGKLRAAAQKAGHCVKLVALTPVYLLSGAVVVAKAVHFGLLWKFDEIDRDNRR